MSGKQTKALRLEAVEGYQARESATEICRLFGKSRGWLYKWLQRKEELQSDSNPKRAQNRTPGEIEEAVIKARKKLHHNEHYIYSCLNGKYRLLL